MLTSHSWASVQGKAYVRHNRHTRRPMLCTKERQASHLLALDCVKGDSAHPLSSPPFSPECLPVRLANSGGTSAYMSESAAMPKLQYTLRPWT